MADNGGYAATQDLFRGKGIRCTRETMRYDPLYTPTRRAKPSGQKPIPK